MRINYVFAVIIIATHIGCASTRFVVDVSSIKVDNNIGKKVFVAPGNNVSINDVQFIEYSGYVKKALVKNGFTIVDSIDESDQVVLLGYAISGPQSYTESIPMFGPTGIKSSSTLGHINSSGNYYSSTMYDYNYGITGIKQVERVYYTRSIVLIAYDWQLFKKTKKEKQLWQTNIVSEGECNDLRYVFPFMIIAAEKYIGKNTRKVITVEVSEYDPRVKEYRDSN
jgi:hypothetical protein